MQSYYLDANIIRNLVEPRDLWPQTAKALQRLVGAGACAVLGSVDLLEELTSLARSDAERYARAIELFWSTIGHKVLRPVGGLIDLEIRTGAPAAAREAYLDAATVTDLRALSSDRRGMASLQEAIRRLKGGDEKRWNDSANRVERDMIARGRAGQAESSEVEFPICEESAQDLFLALADGRREHLGVSTDHVNRLRIDRLPCSRAFLSFCMAQIRRRHQFRAERLFRANDFYDRHHYALAAMAGCLVTEDSPLRRTAAEIGYKPVPLMTGQEFSRRLMNDAQAAGATLRE